MGSCAQNWVWLQCGAKSYMRNCWHSCIRLIIASFVSALFDAVLINFSLLQLGSRLPVTASIQTMHLCLEMNS